MKSIRLTVEETDEAGNPTSTFIYSDGSKGRVDVVSSSKSTSWSKPLLSSLSDVFLPSGYPQSVSDDYLPYQIFDSLQAFTSSIAGLLSSRAVLQGVGVGNPTATPTSALLLHILQDTSGRIATILFAHRVGTALEPECKTYRLAADIFNDVAMVLDCASPAVPGEMRVAVLSAAGILRALCGVAGGSSKASLSAHFAKGGNLAEVNAKDSSQETVISLVGMLVGSLVISHITNLTTTWILLLLLLAAHLGMNYAAVRAVQMTSLNRQRANIVFSTLLDSDKTLLDLDPDADTDANANLDPTKLTLLTPAQVSKQECIFHPDGALRWSTSTSTQTLGTAKIGLSTPSFMCTITQPTLVELTALFQNEKYILNLSKQQKQKQIWHVSILLKKNCSVSDQLKAWTHGLFAARILQTGSDSEQNVLAVLGKTLGALNGRFERYLEALGSVGWEIRIGALETGGGRRVDIALDI